MIRISLLADDQMPLEKEAQLGPGVSGTSATGARQGSRSVRYHPILSLGFLLNLGANSTLERGVRSLLFAFPK